MREAVDDWKTKMQRKQMEEGDRFDGKKKIYDTVKDMPAEWGCKETEGFLMQYDGKVREKNDF